MHVTLLQQHNIKTCMLCVQISHTFFDDPGALAATFVDTEGEAISQDKPYVTMVFCGPADYKASFFFVVLTQTTHSVFAVTWWMSSHKHCLLV